MITTLPCFGEAMYMLGREGGHRLQQGLWNLRRSGGLVVYGLTAAEVDRAGRSTCGVKHEETGWDASGRSWQG